MNWMIDGKSEDIGIPKTVDTTFRGYSIKLSPAEICDGLLKTVVTMGIFHVAVKLSEIVFAWPEETTRAVRQKLARYGCCIAGVENCERYCPAVRCPEVLKAVVKRGLECVCPVQGSYGEAGNEETGRAIPVVERPSFEVSSSADFDARVSNFRWHDDPASIPQTDLREQTKQLKGKARAGAPRPVLRKLTEKAEILAGLPRNALI